MTSNRIWVVALLAFALAWVMAGIVTSKAIATLAGGLDLEVRLAGRDLLMPVAGGRPQRVEGSESRSALDIPAQRGTPVVATDNGRIMALVTTPDGGITVYQADSTNDVVYAYARLERGASGLREGSAVKRGDVIGYVGSASASFLGPRLRFAILRVPRNREWDTAASIDPLPYYVKTRTPTTLAATTVHATP